MYWILNENHGIVVLKINISYGAVHIIFSVFVPNEYYPCIKQHGCQDRATTREIVRLHVSFLFTKVAQWKPR